ncbi:MAG: galactose-1-phosphate uridylyltransferase [Deltaproteobacteria bacterium]|nr:galactose-1-phosphate uridylyltransferase [Candidatus Anaeroferrophillacea bacterium]
MSELRKDPVVDRWVIISKERGRRPSDFATTEPVYSGSFCPFCPGNEDIVPPEILAYRDSGSQPNGPGWRLRVVPNKFPAVTDSVDLDKRGDGIYDRMNGMGVHEVIIETPKHDVTLASMPVSGVEDVLWAYRERLLALSRDDRLQSGIIFKNHGVVAGASVNHSHSQLIALPVVPKQIKEELKGALNHYHYRERCLFCDIIYQELGSQTRMICESDAFIAFSPYAPRFPFETWIIPKTHQSRFEDTDKAGIERFAVILSDILQRLDRVLDNPPYNFVLHSAPFRQDCNAYYHWHLEIMPKLTRIAGFEWGSGFHINPTPPEETARFMRDAAAQAG